MDDRKLVRVGALGALLATVFCITPTLVVVLSVVGLSGAVGYLDYVLLPALAVFVGMLVSEIVRRRRAAAN